MIKKYDFEKLNVWQEAITLIEQIYKLTALLPKEEKYALKNQLQRACTSIALNIAEGKGRYSRKEFLQYLYIARGSLFEVIACIRIAEKIFCIKEENLITIHQQIETIQRQLAGLIKHVRSQLT